MVNVVSVGANPTPIWGMTNRVRTERIARSILSPTDGGDEALILVNDDYVVDPLLLTLAHEQPSLLLVRNGVTILAKLSNPADREPVEAAMLGGSLPDRSQIQQITVDEQFTLYNRRLRKRVHPMVTRLDPSTVRAVERETFFGAYKGVTDLLTKYLWPEWALVLTRVAASLGMSPNLVTAIGLANCIAATLCFWFGSYWIGMAFALAFMVLDTVDGKLARCTITSTKAGSRFDHRIDLIHPPFWWLAWVFGLGAWGLALSPPALTLTVSALLLGYVIDRIVERIFIKRHGFHVHVWERLDSNFRLAGARRNPNMVILFVAMLFRRPDIGIVAVAIWTVFSLVFHAVRLVQAEWLSAKRGGIRSWLS